MSYAADYTRRQSNDAELREAMAAADELIRERKARERAEDEERAAKQRARSRQAAAERQQRLEQHEQPAAEYNWAEFWQDLDRRVAAAVDARVAAYQESERASAEAMRNLWDELSSVRKDLANSRDREAILKERVAVLEERAKQPAPLPVVRQWVPNTAALAGEMFAHHGAMWQAKINTGQEPQEGSNWVCVSAPGRDGEAGRSFRVRGTYDPAKTYRAMDHVVSNGSSFVAKVDSPGPCPGEGWQVVALGGKRGEAGERGLPGRPADVAALEKALRISAWTAGDDYAVTPTHANGQSGATLNLRPLFEKFFAETR